MKQYALPMHKNSQFSVIKVLRENTYCLSRMLTYHTKTISVRPSHLIVSVDVRPLFLGLEIKRVRTTGRPDSSLPRWVRVSPTPSATTSPTTVTTCRPCTSRATTTPWPHGPTAPWAASHPCLTDRVETGGSTVLTGDRL